MKKYTGNILIIFAFIISIGMNIFLMTENSKTIEYKSQIDVKEKVILQLEEKISDLENDLELVIKDNKVNLNLISSMERELERLEKQISDKNREINFLYNELK